MTDFNASKSLGKVIAFHSYKGGTGKTTFVANLGALYADMGMRVCLLDFDMYAPSLTTYFRKTPKTYLNNFFMREEDISNVLVDVSSELGVKGKLFLGLSSPSKDDIQDIEIKPPKWQFEALRRYIAAQTELFSDYKLDYIFIDTSPGIRYWSINAIGVSDALFLLLKINDMDITGTKKMKNEIVDELKKFGSQCFLILNKVPGAMTGQESAFADYEKSWEAELEQEIGTPVIGSVPCFCDIQFSRHEFLFAIKQPDHPFSKKLIDLAVKIQEVTRGTENEAR
jgi:MinD-like ATPase involved in chromosome partitioning or flagellar assembly